MCTADDIRGLARLLRPIAGHIVTVPIIHATLAAKDMAAHSRAVRRVLESRDLASAGEKVGMIVGRDTDRLDEGERGLQDTPSGREEEPEPERRLK